MQSILVSMLLASLTMQLCILNGRRRIDTSACVRGGDQRQVLRGGRSVGAGGVHPGGRGGGRGQKLWEVLDGGGVELEPNQYRSAVGRRPLVVDAVLREGERRRGHP